MAITIYDHHEPIYDSVVYTVPVLGIKEKSDIKLRDYQQSAYDAISKDLDGCRSTLCVLATGLGKTILFSKIIANWPDRVLVLVHLEELLQNAYSEIESITGEILGIERGGETHLGERIVVGTVQTVSRKLHRYKENHFSLIIIDEAHHAASDIYIKILDYFHDAKVVGLTATDERSDEKPLPFQKCSYRMGIREGIQYGYLVPVKGRRIIIESIDLTRVKRTGKNEEGDFDDTALDDEMVKGASAIADVICSDYPFDKGILFFPGCASAKLTSELLNKRLPGISVYIDGKITGQTRRKLIQSLRNGESNWLCNVGIATEGFNWPNAAIIGMCCPTTSKSAYVQRAGRGTRPLAGLLNGIETPSERRAAIEASEKPYMTILDFVGSSANINLITSESLLEDVGKKEKHISSSAKTTERSECNSENEIQRDVRSGSDSFGGIVSGIQSRTLYGSEEFDPVNGLSETNQSSISFGKVQALETDLISDKQYRLLIKYGIDDSKLSRKDAQKLISFAASKSFRLSAFDKKIILNLYRKIKNHDSENQENVTSGPDP